MEGADGMEIGTSPMLRGAAWQSSSNLAWLITQSSVSAETLLFPCFLSFCHSLPVSLFCVNPFSLDPDFLSPPCSVSCYQSPYSVRLCTVRSAAADSPSSLVRSSPPPMTSSCRGAFGSHSFTDDPVSLWTQKRRIPIYTTAANWKDSCRKKKWYCGWWRVHWTHSTQVWDCCHSLISCHSCSRGLKQKLIWHDKEKWNCTELHHMAPKEGTIIRAVRMKTLIHISGELISNVWGSVCIVLSQELCQINNWQFWKSMALIQL